MKKLFIFWAFLTPVLIRSQQVEVPARIQFALYTKIFAFDRNLENRNHNPGGIVIGIVYQEKVPASVLEKNEMVAAIRSSVASTVNGMRISYKLIPISEGSEALSSLQNADVSMFYLTPIRGVDVSEILSVSRSRKIFTLSGVPSYCDKGVSVCIENSGEKPGIIIHLASAKMEGSDLSSQLLKMARVIQ